MLELLRQRWESRTYRAAMILAALTIVEANYGILTPLLPALLQPYAVLLWPIAMMFCREITTTALSDK